MANIKAQDLPEKLTKAVPDDRVLMIDSEDYNRLKTQPAEYYRWDDWVSPTVNVIDTPPWQTPAWHTVEITDVNWTKSFFVKDWWWDMEKAVYDKNDNGIVDDAEALGWRPAEDYALKEDVQDHINTKTFYIKWESDLTTAQEIFERFKQGKNPIVIYQNVSFNMSNLFNDRLEFMASKDLPYDNSLCTPACMIYYSWNNVTSVKLRMLTAIDIKTINNETLLWQWNITIKWWAYERPVIKINLTPDKTVYKKWATASITELKAVITKWSADLQSVTFKKNDAVISEVTEWIKDWWEVICNCGTALNNLTENTKLTVEVNDGESVTSEIVNIEFVNPFYYWASASNIVNWTAWFTEDVSTKWNKTYAYSPNWEHNTIIYDDSYWELKDIRDDNWFSLISWFSTWTFEEWTVTYRYYAETNATNDDNVEYTYYFTEGGWWWGGGWWASIAIDTALSTTSGNPVQNKVITTAMQGKQDILESGVNIKTINGNSLLGWWNIEIQGWEEKIKVFPIDAEWWLWQPEDIIHAQQAYDFLLQGWMPILVYNNKTYTLDSRNDYTVYFRAWVKREHRNDESRYLTEYILFDKQWDTVTHCSVITVNNWARYLDTGVNYSNPYNPQYPWSPATKKYVDDSVATKQDTLVSGTNIKTINWNSLLGNGNIEIQWWTTISVDSELSDTSENPVQNKVIKQALDAKANTTDIPDVSNFATKSELPDMTDYYDKAEVDALIPDVSGFITKDVDNLTYYTKTADLPSVPTKTSELTNDSWFITSADIPAIPSKTSDLTNDSWFITNSVNNLTNYYTKTETDWLVINKLDKITAWTLDKAYVVTTEWVQTAYNISQWASSNTIVRRSWTGIIVPDTPWDNTHAVNKNYVDNAIAGIPPTDLSNYYTKTEIDNKNYVAWYESWYTIRLLTQAQYDALSTKDAKTVYIINW